MNTSKGIYKTDIFSVAGLMVNLVAATAVLFIPISSVKAAQQDGWMATVVATLYGAYILCIVYKLGMLFPGKTFMEYLPLILGKVVGKILGVFYIIFLFYLTSSVLREALALYYGTGAYRLTPPTVLAVFLIIASTYAVLSGIEVLGRTSNIYSIVVIIFFILTICLASPYMKLESLLPIGEAGLANVIKEALYLWLIGANCLSWL